MSKSIKLFRRYSLALSNYCKGGCDYCIQKSKYKLIEDKDSDLKDTLSRLRTFIDNTKKSHEKLCSCYDLSCSLMGGELLDAPLWFQKELIPLVQELSNYMYIVFFTNGISLNSSPLGDCIKELAKNNRATFFIHLIYWMKHPYNYWKRIYKEMLGENVQFALVIRPEEVGILSAWGDHISPAADNIPIFINRCVGNTEIPTVVTDLYNRIMTITNGTGSSAFEVPISLRRKLCRYIVQHGGGTIKVIDKTCALNYICCGSDCPGHAQYLPEVYNERVNGGTLNPEDYAFIPNFPEEFCSECTNMVHYDILYKLKDPNISMGDIVEIFRKIEMTDWKNS